MQKIKIKVSKLASFFRQLGFYFHRAYILLGIRQEKKFWGCVFDAKTKQPLDPVMIKLISADNGHEVQTCITDLKGRYGFLVSQGKYKLFAVKTNYSFPSKLVKGESDGGFENLYHGEFFEVLGGSEVVAPNIPMDAISPDWNQAEKRRMLVYGRARLLKVLSFFSASLFWIFFLASLVKIVLDVKKTSGVVSSFELYVLGSYAFVFFLNFILPKIRLWGRVIDAKTKKPLTNIQIELINPVIKDSVLAKTMVGQDGKFFLRANPGIYEIVFKSWEEDKSLVEIGSVKIRVSAQGLVNQTFYFEL